MSVSEMESYRDLILENIEYDHLCREFTTYREDLDEIVELMVETVCAKRKTTRIAGSDFPHEVVRSRFLKLDCSHIEFVMECLRNNMTELVGTVQSIRQQINPKLKIGGVFLTMANDTNFRRDIVAGVKENFGKYLPVMEAVIPSTVRLAEISTADKSIFRHEPNGRAARAYGTLVKEVEGIGEKQRIRPADIAR